jgi:hypothetical protein
MSWGFISYRLDYLLIDSTVEQLNALRTRLTVLIMLFILAMLFCGYFALIGLKPGNQLWEYRIEAVPDTGFQDAINKLGANGWDLVFARRASDGNTNNPTMNYEMIFKRPVQNTLLRSQ